MVGGGQRKQKPTGAQELFRLEAGGTSGGMLKAYLERMLRAHLGRMLTAYLGKMSTCSRRGRGWEQPADRMSIPREPCSFCFLQMFLFTVFSAFPCSNALKGWGEHSVLQMIVNASCVFALGGLC